MMERAVRFDNHEDSEDEQKNPIKLQQRRNETSPVAKETCKMRKNDGNSKDDGAESFGRWRTVSNHIRNAVSLKNSVRPSRLQRRRSTWKSAGVTVDPFLQKYFFGTLAGSVHSCSFRLNELQMREISDENRCVSIATLCGIKIVSGVRKRF